MRRFLSLVLFALTAASALAESHNPADYPLRIHIFKRSETTFYHHRVEEEAKGEGKANLFENGDPRGIDFQFECDNKLQTSSGPETFPAKWKKPGEELVILQPRFGSGGYDTCKLKVIVKEYAYYSHNGSLSTEPVAAFKQWMNRHDYDPEHGKNGTFTGNATPDQTNSPAAPARSPAATPRIPSGTRDVPPPVLAPPPAVSPSAPGSPTSPQPASPVPSPPSPASPAPASSSR